MNTTSINPKVTELFAAIDRMDAKGFAGFLAEDGRFWFGNQPAVQGRRAVEEAVGGFFSSLGGLSHQLHRAFEQQGAMVVEGEVTYTRKDARQVTLPFCNTFVMKGEGIAEYRIYADLAPLFAA